MSPVLLMHALRTFLETGLAGGLLPVPMIHVGCLPDVKSEETPNEERPLILILPQEGEDVKEQYRVKILLQFAAKSREGAGVLDVLNLMERVRILLLETRLLNKCFSLEMPYQWKLYDEQIQMQTGWFGEAVTVWTLPHVMEEVEYGC